MKAAPTAVVADAHVVTRTGIRRALERAGITVVDEVGDADGAVAAVRWRSPEVCLLAAGLPGGTIAAVGEIAASAPATSAIVLLETGRADELVAALRAGARGCLAKDVGSTALGRAVHGALAGEVLLPRALAGRVLDELRRCWGERRARTATGSWVTLSEREAEVLRLMHRELTTKEIAERLGISAVTVRRHVSDTVRRLGVRDRDAALELTATRPAARPTAHDPLARA
jgi:DNA-binding NarL/FixJ family response regulator